MERIESAFSRLYSIVARLRAPDGCPWDREQTPTTLRGNVIEEAYELVEAIESGDAAHVREEAGDVYLLATMICYMHEQEGTFSVADALDAICEKLVRRHPHVFGDSDADTSEKVLAQWNEIKEKVEGRAAKDSLLDSVPRALPPLERAYRMQKKAAKVGFDWTRVEEVWDKAAEELAEAREACESLAALRRADPSAGEPDPSGEAFSRLEDELGDLLFSVINVSRFLGVDPSVALHRTVGKFAARFRHVERRMGDEGRALEASEAARMNELWEEAKRTLG